MTTNPISLQTLARLGLCRFLHLKEDSPGLYTLDLARIDRNLEVTVSTYHFPEDADDLDAINAAREIFSELSRPNIIAISARHERDQRVLNDLIRPLGWSGLFRINPPEALFRGTGAPRDSIAKTPHDGAMALATSIAGLAQEVCQMGVDRATA